jgi:hypothetical protein
VIIDKARLKADPRSSQLSDHGVDSSDHRDKFPTDELQSSRDVPQVSSICCGPA